MNWLLTHPARIAAPCKQSGRQLTVPIVKKEDEKGYGGTIGFSLVNVPVNKDFVLVTIPEGMTEDCR